MNSFVRIESTDEEMKTGRADYADEAKNGSGQVVDHIHGGLITGYNTEKPPDDDCCPICYCEFTVPCRTNCGHWFCGNCILQLWQYRARPRSCECPFCSCRISKLTPEESILSQKEDEVVQVLKDIQQYNQLYVGGLQGFLQVLMLLLRQHVPAMPLYIWWMFRWLIAFIIRSPKLLFDLVISTPRVVFAVVIGTPQFWRRLILDLTNPDRMWDNAARVRMIAGMMSFTFLVYYHLRPRGLTEQALLQQWFVAEMWIDLGAVILILIPYWYGLTRRWMLRRRERLLASEETVQQPPNV